MKAANLDFKVLRELNFMSKFGRKKIAVTLAFTALFGNKSSAMNTSKNRMKNPQTLEAVGGRALVLINQKGLLQTKKQL